MEFDYLKNNKKRFKILDKLYKTIGEGSSRRVYLLPDGKVIKIPITVGGFYQNKNEIKIYKKYNNENGILNKLYLDESDPKGAFVIQDYINPIRTPLKFNNLIFNSYDICSDIKEVLQLISRTKKKQYQVFLYGLIELEKVLKIDRVPDLYDENVGTKKGKILLLDYGYTKDLISKKNYYKEIA